MSTQKDLVGVVAQSVGAAVGAAHALCLGGVEVALADDPGGLVAGELERGGGGQELHQPGGFALFDDTTLSFLHRFGERFRADTQCDKKQRRHYGSTASRLSFGKRASPLAPGPRLFRTSHERTTAVSVDFRNRRREQAWTVAVAVLPPIVRSSSEGHR